MALAKISIMSIFTKSDELAASDIAAPEPGKKSFHCYNLVSGISVGHLKQQDISACSAYKYCVNF
jgi:hypothetical protein